MNSSKQKISWHAMALVMLNVLLPWSIAAAATADYMLEFGGRNKTTELSLSIGKSQIIGSREKLDQVVIGSPKIADIKLLSSRHVLILGKKPGRTNLVFRNDSRSLLAVIDVVVGYDLSDIKRKIYEALPQEKGIEIRGENDAVMLSGQVSDLLAMDTAMAIAASYVPKKKVINMLQVGGGQQVMLIAKIAEVARNSLRELGIQSLFSATTDSGKLYSIVTGTPFAGSFGSIAHTRTTGGFFDSISVTLQALESKGLAKTLAEPNLIALSGQEASFLAGGEFPVPVAQTTGAGVTPTITVDYKEFGVALKFTPTVLSGKKINLKLNTEVSAIDSSTSTPTGGGLSVPGLTTRRAGTSVEIADGQSFAIAGLIQSDMSNAIEQFPGLGDIPVIGALFRSTKFQRKETELVITVTPRLVRTVPGAKLSYPTDNFVPPNAIDQYLLGRVSGFPPPSDKQVSSSAESTQHNGAVTKPQGIEGSFGHEQP